MPVSQLHFSYLVFCLSLGTIYLHIVWPVNNMHTNTVPGVATVCVSALKCPPEYLLVDHLAH